MFRWRLVVALWIVAVGFVLIAELGIRREPRTTYDTHYAYCEASADAATGPSR